MEIVFQPLIPEYLAIIIAVMALAGAAVHLFRAPQSGFFRLIAALALIGLLANPKIRVSETTPLSDIALILIDKSASQALDGRDTVTQDAAAKTIAQLDAMDQMETRIVEVAGTEETRIETALQEALADIPNARIAGAVVVTDGQTTDAGTVRTDAKFDYPIHVLLTGREDEFDRKINLVTAPHYGIVRENAEIAFRVDDIGPDGVDLGAGGSAMVALRVDGKEILRQSIPVGTLVAFSAPLDRPGETIIELIVDERPGELTLKNNVAVLPITAVRDRLRVLLISGEPHPGERTWRNLLKSDPAVDLVHFTILRPIEKNDGTPPNELALIQFPQDELFIEKLGEFDLLVFDRYTYRGVLTPFHFDNIARYVEEGGAVLIASGPEFNGPLSLAAQKNLSFVLPATPGNRTEDGPFRPQITDEGHRHPVTAELPEEDFWGRWLRSIPVTKHAGDTLMSGPGDAPLLILNRVGEGRVGLFLSDHIWLWARGFDGGGPHAELLRRISHWLMKEPELEEERLLLSSNGTTLIIDRRSMSEDPEPVTVETPDGQQREVVLNQVSPGIFAGKIDNAEPGLYRATTGDLFAIGSVGLAATPEYADVISTAQKLYPLVEASGAGVFRIRERNASSLPTFKRIRTNATTRSGEGWAGFSARRAARVDAVRDAPFAPPWAWLALMAAALGAGWFVESGRAKMNEPSTR